MSAAHAEIERSTTAIAEKNNEMNAVRGNAGDDMTKSKAFSDAATMARNQITERHVTQINEILEVAAPDGLVIGLEELVGLLRDVKQADNVDVELFFRDPVKLLTKLRRMKAADLNIDYVKAHLTALQEVKEQHFSRNEMTVENPKRKGEKQFNIYPFRHFIDWGIEFS